MLSSSDTITTERHTGRQPGLALLRFADCEIDTATRSLLRHGAAVPIRRQVFDLLLMLVQRRPGTVGLDELRLAVWGREQVAPSAVARAVLEARRAIGDIGAASQLIVNVHGVGYRFAGHLQQAPTPTPALPLPQDSIQAHLQEAENAYNLRSDAARARYHAEMALAEAMRQGLNVASGQALCWLGWLAMWSGSIEEATRHVQHALQLASSENHDGLQARARTVDAFVHLSLGDFDRAMVLLQQAHPVLQREGRSGDRYRHRCEYMMSAAARHLGQLDAALQWCLGSQRSARAAGLDRALLRTQCNEVEIGIERGEAQQRQGQSQQAQQTWRAALELCLQLLQQIDPQTDAWLHAACIGNHTVLLGRLGHYAQARLALHTLERIVEGLETPDAPAVRERRAMLKLLRVRLCFDEGDHARALCEVQAALSEAAPQHENGPWKPALLELASRVAESCGRLDLALLWSRQHHAAHVALEGARARILLQTLQAESQQAALVDQLEAARRNIRFLEQMNAELLLRRPLADAPAGTALPGLN